jgi:GT2 family glycosyltransferase
MFPKVAIIILNWNGYEDTIKCIESIFQIVYQNYDIIVVDNNSVDGSVEKIRTCLNNRGTIIENAVNLGFAKANNIAINYAINQLKSEYVFLLNNDTIVDSLFLFNLVNVAEKDKEIGIIGPKIFNLNSDGKSNEVQKYGGTINWWLYPGYHWNHKNLDCLLECDWVSGTAMLIRSNMPVHLLNTDYYFGCEDVDICLRAKRCGYKIVVISNSFIWHKGGASRKKRPSFFIGYFKDIQTNLLFVKNTHPISLPFYIVCLLLLNCYYLLRKCTFVFTKQFTT